MSASAEFCSDHGSWQEEELSCKCTGYYVGSSCQIHLWQIVGRKLQIMQIVWLVLYIVQIAYALYVLKRYWIALRRFVRAALSFIILAALSQIGFRSCNIKAFNNGLGCEGTWICPIIDFFLSLFYANMIITFLLYIYAWQTITALIKSKTWLARKGTKIFFAICSILGYLGAFYILIATWTVPGFQYGDSSSFFIQAYYLVVSAFILVLMMTSGFPVLRLIWRTEDNNAFRFTTLLLLLSTTGLLHLLTSILYVAVGGARLPSFYFWGHHVINSSYMWLFGWIVILSMRPTRMEMEASYNRSAETSLMSGSSKEMPTAPATPTSPRRARPVAADAVDSSELFSTISTSRAQTARSSSSYSIKEIE